MLVQESFSEFLGMLSACSKRLDGSTWPQSWDKVYCHYNWAQILSPLMGVKASCEVGLKSTQAWGCPCSIKCLFLRHIVSFYLFSPPSSYSPFSYWLFHFFKIGEIFVCIRLHSSSLGWKAGLRSRPEIGWDYSQLQHRVLSPTFLFEYSLWEITPQVVRYYILTQYS